MRDPDPFVPRLFRVEEARRENADTTTLGLVPSHGEIPSFLPGQFFMLYAFGVAEIPVSVSGLSGTGRLLHTIRAVGAGSRALCRLRPGDFLGARGPYGSAWPLDRAEGDDLLLIAGGLGAAPIRSALLRALAERERYGRVVFLYGARGPTELLFRPELEGWQRRPDLEVQVTVDHAPPSWRGSVGVVPERIGHARFSPAHTTAFVCGPEVMMRFTASALLAAGVSSERIFLSMERNMKCALALCGRCQFGPAFVCREGPIFRYDRIARLLFLREI
ncbi:sulfhydrogenase subunit gamma (sulfur reductase) [Methylacidimicrobium cyclopophantes]|uniref:Sulfhydrogenase subunit gamma (Sulfur reductase) n=1 Tax=Methylacidimicrobium cyclopophantes TaxID=1041766 RepID=A0A5E6MF91_9BACT|nr:FAD/NAD(P)-binding protein [Methylacidimicrobium cyclopophantes]VVM06911.1 sulfhydrogenase subunit gamma (sulfur reductase) [Methylacidimicrobium cyclopophantes]